MNKETSRNFNTLKEFKARALKDEEVKAQYDALEDEFHLINELIKARTAKKLTQADLAKKTGLKQAAIARLCNPRTYVVSYPSLCK